jgi:hypothetical protein
LAGNDEKLSEAGVTSDRFDEKRQKAVRSRGGFGQVEWEKVKTV